MQTSYWNETRREAVVMAQVAGCELQPEDDAVRLEGEPRMSRISREIRDIQGLSRG
jgi:hypothetical protein